MSTYIKPAAAYKKLDAARLLRQGIYIYAATGFGKTELIKQYFKNDKYVYIPCRQNTCDLSAIPENGGRTAVVVIDNVNAVESSDIRGRIKALCGRKDLWVTIIGRSRMPSWLFEKNSVMFQGYLENSIISEMNTEIVDFLLKISIVDNFTEPLAAMITGNSAVQGLIGRTMDIGNFIDERDGVYTLRMHMLKALRRKAVKELSESELRHYAVLAGGYFESRGEDNKALTLYAEYNESDRIRELLIRNSRKNPGSGYYIEMRKYYFMLSEDDIRSNVYLMSAMILYRKGEEWERGFIQTLEKICEYKFIPIISEEGVGVYDLLKQCEKQCAKNKKISNKWF
ncbi:MAG: hypothetical protein J6C96_07080 [Oscillospiraceae bacterium]|nr:hypothetical protein [Oscillospiraceae bacterium]